jgi:hypothetical protein
MSWQQTRGFEDSNRSNFLFPNDVQRASKAPQIGALRKAHGKKKPLTSCAMGARLESSNVINKERGDD